MRLREELIGRCESPGKYREAMKAWPAEVFGLRGEISKLALAPIKSLGMLELPSAIVTKQGLFSGFDQGSFSDRMAMLAIRSFGEFRGQNYDLKRLSQREEGGLALAKASLEGPTLCYDAPDCSRLEIRADSFHQAQGANVQVFSDKEIFPGRIEDGPITQWVREMLSKNAKSFKYDIDDVEVVLLGRRFERPVQDIHRRDVEGAETYFSDGGQILTASSSTLKWMNEDREMPRVIGMEAMRPNIVVKGWPVNIEDVIDAIRIRGTNGQVQMLFGELSVRCSVTGVDNRTGEKPDTEPLTWMNKYRPRRANKPTFAVNTVVPNHSLGKRISEGDSVEILSEKQP